MPLWVVRAIVASGKIVGLTPETLPAEWWARQDLYNWVMEHVISFLSHSI